jgi:LPS sulfotransferase NodH
VLHDLLCATPRSGSTLVAELLAQTGIAGIPNEHLLDWLPQRDRREPAFWLELLQRTVDAGATGNGVAWTQQLRNDPARRGVAAPRREFRQVVTVTAP